MKFRTRSEVRRGEMVLPPSALPVRHRPVVVGVMSAWSAKIRRAPCRHCSDARVYGHTTTAVHNRSAPPPPSPPPSSCLQTAETSGESEFYLPSAAVDSRPVPVWSAIPILRDRF